MVELVGLVAIECAYAQNVEDGLYSKGLLANLCDGHDMVELIDAINHSLVGAAPPVEPEGSGGYRSSSSAATFCCGFRSCKSG